MPAPEGSGVGTSDAGQGKRILVSNTAVLESAVFAEIAADLNGVAAIDATDASIIFNNRQTRRLSESRMQSESRAHESPWHTAT